MLKKVLVFRCLLQLLLHSPIHTHSDTLVAMPLLLTDTEPLIKGSAEFVDLIFDPLPDLSIHWDVLFLSFFKNITIGQP